MRAPVLGYALRFLSGFLALGFSHFDGESTTSPQASNAVVGRHTSIQEIMMNKIVLRLIGIFAFFVGIVSLYQVIEELFTTPSLPLIATINNIVLAWIAIFGGYKTAKLMSSGRKSLCIYFMFRILGTVLFFGGLIFTWIKVGGNLWIEPSQQPSTLLYIGYFVFSIAAIVLLLRKKNAEVFEADNNTRQGEFIGKVLSQITPGLGRAFIGNIWAGFALFMVYSILVSGHFYLSISSVKSYPMGLFIFEIVYDLVVWRIFAWVDWEFVKKAIKSKEGLSTPIVYSE